MKEETFLLLLLHSLEAVAASQCWRGTTFSEAVVSPAVDSSGIVRVPGVASLPQCVAACCDLPGYDLAWLFKGRCYVLSCQQRENCRPQERPGADSVLAFLRRPSPQTLVLQSLVRGKPYGARWEPLTQSSEAGTDLEALKDLALFDRPQPGFSDPGVQDVEYSEGSQEEIGGAGSEVDSTRDGFNHSEAKDGPERGPTQTSRAQITLSSDGPQSWEDEDGTSRPAGADAAKKTTLISITSTSPMPSADSAHHMRSSAPPADETIAAMATTGRPLTFSLGNPVEPTLPTEKQDVTIEDTRVPDTSEMLQAPPPTAHSVTSDPTRTPSAVSVAVTPPPAADVRGSNRGPLAVVGPDRRLFLPLSSVVLNGSGSSDDGGISSYSWELVSGPPGLKLEHADQAVAMATGVQVGRYTFRLTVWDQEGASDSALLTVRIQEARSLPPVAHASGSHTLTLPNNSLVLRGSVTNGDMAQVHYRWTRDRQSPAAGVVLYGSESQACLYLADLVEGTYLFQLRVTDAQGRSSSATATVEVQPEPGGDEQVELEMLVSVSQVSVAQRDMLVRQLAALIHVLESDVQVRVLQGRSHLSTVLRFAIQGPSGPFSGSRLVGLLRNQLLREKSDYLLFRVLRVDTIVCQLSCSGRGQCHPITKQCSCDPFWTENLIRHYLGDGESNCEWRVLYVVLSSFILMIFILTLSWTFICCCRRRQQTKSRKKTKYTILDNMDEQERVELRPRFSIKHRSTEHNSSLMMSESELDSDQDTVFSRDRPVRSRNRISAQAARNGNAFG
ncbi:dyslexia-associated protein KIAA0319 isoform X2 [Melanotaenia boesemani]|uniref:dyslexia-associated protein KIAA0319 isoform X2 n=1 Tax=Melanotaenia boesemani TaxID=1250792 RepID=UPI001C05B9DC|nr:dyslexia-associated protein KIAA0319 isoform X2 [Melanotaenia boesemani]